MFHDNIVDIYESGNDGIIKQPSGKLVKNVHYLLLEYVEGTCLFDLVYK